MKLKECLVLIDNHLSETQKEEIKTISKRDLISYQGLMMWIRNNCFLWRDGTSEIENDLYFLMDNGYHLQNMTELLKQKLESEDPTIDYNLKHPDNCSFIILEAYQEFLLEKLPIDLLT